MKATFLHRENALCGFALEGHCGGVAGSDIVCAAVSSAAYMAANTISDILHVPVEAEVEDGFMSVRLPEPEKAQDILRGLRLHLQALSGQYPDDINFREV